MNAKKLEIFVGLCEAKTFSSAAASLELSQPYVSRVLNEVEAYYGALLVNRSGPGVDLTPLGRYFYTQTKQLLRQQSSLTSSLAKSSKKSYNCIHMPSFSVGKTMSLLSSCMDNHKLIVHQKELCTVFDYLSYDLSHLALGYVPSHSLCYIQELLENRGFESVELEQKQLCVYLHNSHILARKESFGVDDIHQAQLIRLECGAVSMPSYDARIRFKCKELNSLEFATHSDSIHFVLQLMRNSEGILLDAHASHNDYLPPDICMRPLGFEENLSLLLVRSAESSTAELTDSILERWKSLHSGSVLPKSSYETSATR